MDWMKELHIAAEMSQKVAVILTDGTKTFGLAEVSTDPERAKIRTSEGPVWVPYEDIEKVSRVINMFH